MLLQVTDTTTFTDEKRRAEVDAWLYETCTQCLQHMIDITVQFYSVVEPLVTRILDLLLNFIRQVAGWAAPSLQGCTERLLRQLGSATGIYTLFRDSRKAAGLHSYPDS